MTFNHLKSFALHLRKNKLYSVVTILGFSISLMFILLLSVYIKNEYSADQFHLKKDRTYRLTHGEESDFVPPSEPLLIEKCPEIESFTRTRTVDLYSKASGTHKLKNLVMFADSSFLTIFSFKMFEGDKKTALIGENTVILTKSFAYKLFGKLPKLGTTLTINDKMGNHSLCYRQPHCLVYHAQMARKLRLRDRIELVDFCFVRNCRDGNYPAYCFVSILEKRDSESGGELEVRIALAI